MQMSDPNITPEEIKKLLSSCKEAEKACKEMANAFRKFAESCFLLKNILTKS
jgi:UDP-N-acetylglucosamine:LPS N-acetylglucosamine transferase